MQNTHHRETCWRCFWPKDLCWCNSVQAMPTKTKFVILMHPKEFKKEKANTGRLASLCLQNSEIHMGLSFEDHPRVLALLADPKNQAMVLFPDPDALILDTQSQSPGLTLASDKQLVCFLMDATWSCANAMVKQNPTLMTLPKLMFQSPQKSRYTIKRQPKKYCLSTLETCHELLLALEKTGYDQYPDKKMMISLFDRMQDLQVEAKTKRLLGKLADE